MRLRLLAAAVAVASAGSLAPAQADPLYFTRECAGKLDSQCYWDFCGIFDCIRTDCLVYSEVFGSGNAATCIGRQRPRDPVS
jgi:hypothetical protein